MSKSLGVLTLDLIAKTSGFVDGLSKAERASAKSKKQMEKDFKAIANTAKLAAAAMAAGATAMAVATVQSAKEIKNLSAVAGTSAEQFQKYSFAAKRFGIEQEKLADIFKDTNDKIGDFVQTGGGALADFFENIAPQVGVTAEQFQKLSGADALGLYVSSLEKANVSQNDMTFYLEAIASDATALLPLLKNNSEGFKSIGEEAEKLGLVMKEGAIQNSSELIDNLSILNSTFKGTANTVVSNFIPVLTEMSKALAQQEIQSQAAAKRGQFLTEVFKLIAQAAVGAVGYIDTYAKTLAGLVFIASQVPEGFDAIKNAVSLVGEELDSNIQKYDAYLKRIQKIGTEQIEGSSGASPASVASGFTPIDMKEKNKRQTELESLEESFASELEMLQEKHEEENLLLAEAREQKLETVRSYDELELMLAERQAEQLKELERKSQKEKLGITQGALKNLSTLMNSESRKAFEVGKAAAIANAIVAGYDSAVLAYEGGLKVSGGNPVVGAAFAATALAATGAHIQSIRATKFGAGGGGAGGGASNAQAVNNASVGVTPQQTQTEQRSVFIRGIDKDSLYSGEQLLDLLNNELSNGGKIIANG
jgi:hypothetical protein